MHQKKICMLGSFAVGKTSLARRFVESIFSDKYLTTVGVKIDKKVISVDGEQVKLMIWDLEGEDDYSKIRPSYLRGSAGYILVVDATRSGSLEVAADINRKAIELLGRIPAVIALNKVDLEDEQDIDVAAVLARIESTPVFKTSAKTEQGVEEMFVEIASLMIKNP